MAKGSGNTKGSRWRNNETSAWDRAIDFLVERIKTGQIGQWGDDNVNRREMNAWEQLSDKERLSVLEECMLDAIKADYKSLIEGKYNRRERCKRVRDLQAKIVKFNAYCKEHNLKIYKAENHL